MRQRLRGEATVRHVREMSAEHGLADSRDAVVELAVERLYREALDRVQSDRWAAAAPIRRSWRRCAKSWWISTATPRGQPDPPIVERWGIDLIDFDPTVGHEQAGTRRMTATEVGGRRQSVTDPAIRAAVRSAITGQLGLDLAAEIDGAA